jgi:hypothetical protein
MNFEQQKEFFAALREYMMVVPRKRAVKVIGELTKWYTKT